MDNLKPLLDQALRGNPQAARFGYGPNAPKSGIDLSGLSSATAPAPLAQKGDYAAPATPGGIDLSSLSSEGAQQSTLEQGVNTAGRGFVRGALESVGQTMRGVAADPLGGIEMAGEALMPAVKLENEALRRLGIDPAEMLRPANPQQSALYKAGQAVSDIEKRPDLQPPKGWEQGWTDQISGAFGSTAPYFVTGAMGPGAGLTAGTLLGMWSGAGQAMDSAIQKGATKEQILQAAHLGNIPGSTETLPMEVLFERVPLPAMGKFATALGHVLATAAAEGGQEGMQQAAQNLIAKWVYDPKQDITEQVAQSALLGAVVGGGAAIAEHAIPGGHEAQQPPPGPQTGPAGPAAALNGEILPPEASGPPPPPAGNIERPTIDLTANQPSGATNVQDLQQVPGTERPAPTSAILPGLPRPADAGLAGGEAQNPSPVNGAERGSQPQAAIAPPQSGAPAPTVALDLSHLSSRGAVSAQSVRDGVVAHREPPADLAERQTILQHGSGNIDAPAQGAQPLLGDDTAPLHGMGNGGVRNVQSLRDLAEIKPLLDKGYRKLDRPSRAIVDARVLGSVDDPQIFNAVISRVPVDMVNMLASEQFPADRLLHDGTMFKNAVLATPNLRIRGRIVDAIVSTLTPAITEVKALPLPGLAESSSAVGAKELGNDSHVDIGIPASHPRQGRRVGAGQDPERGMLRQPVLTMLKRSGGIAPNSTLAGELRSMGVTYRSAPGLFRRGGRGAADNFVASEHPIFAHHPHDGTGHYIPEETILDAIRDEIFGMPWRSLDEQEEISHYNLEARNQDYIERELDAVLHEFGLGEDAQLRDRARQLMADGADADSAVESAAVSAVKEDNTDEENSVLAREAEIPFFGDANVEPQTGAQGGTGVVGNGEDRQPGSEARAPPQPEANGGAGEPQSQAINLSHLSSEGRNAGNEHGISAGRGLPGEPDTGGLRQGTEPSGPEVRPGESANASAGRHDTQGGVARGDAGASAEVALAGNRRDKEREYYERMQAKDRSTDIGPEGKEQTVIPGAEREANASFLQRKADAPLKPKAAQKGADEGLFGDGHKQNELFAGARAIDWTPGGGSREITFGDTTITYGVSRDTAEIILVKTAKAKRGEGSARRALERFVSDADAQGLTLFLNAEPMESRVSASGLKRLYKSVGFKDNLGRNKDFRSRAGMVRPPSARPSLAGKRVPGRDVQKIVDDVLGIIEKMAAKGTALEVREKLTSGNVQSLRASGHTADDSSILGKYEPLRGVISVSLEGNEQVPIATHEAWHSVEPLLTADQWKILRREEARLHSVAAHYLGYDNASEIPLSFREKVANAQEAYFVGKQVKGLHIAVRSIFDRIARVLRQIRNYLHGAGFKTSEDLFDLFHEGEVRSREEDIAPVETLDEQLASRRKRRPDPNAMFQTPEERRVLAKFIRRVSFGMVRGGINVSLLDRKFANRAEAMGRVQQSILDSGASFPTGMGHNQPPEEFQFRIGELFPENFDMARAEELYYGRAGERVFQLRTQRVEPIMAKLRAAGVTAQQFDDYLYARHAPERNRELRRINPLIPDPSGMSDREAADILRNAPPILESIARDVDAMNQETRDRLRNSGLISDEVHQDWSTHYRHYVPLRGFEGDSEESEDLTGPRSKGFDLNGPEAHKAFGRRSKADSPLAYSIAQAQHAIIRSEKNRVANRLLRLAMAFKNKEIWEVNRAEKKRRVNPATGLVEEYWVAPQAVAQMDQQRVITVKTRGKLSYVTIHHDGLLAGLRMLGAEKVGELLRLSGKAMRFMSKAFTTFDPTFLLRNFFRDLGAAIAHLTEEKQRGLIRHVLRDLPSSVAGMWHYLRGHPETTSPWTKHAYEFTRAGGKVSFVDMNSIDQHKRELQSAIEGKKWLKVHKTLGRLIEDANGSIENAIRLATYVNLRSVGYSEDRAAHVARDLTVDFNKKGELTQLVNGTYLFFNANMQGDVRVGKAVKRSKIVRRGLLGLAVMGALLDWINYILGGDDPTDHMNNWDKVPQYEKDRNLILMWPDGSGRYSKFPMTYVYNGVVVSGEQISAFIRYCAHRGAGSDPVTAVLNSFWSVFNATSPFAVARAGYSWAVPTIIQPFTEMLENKDYTDAPIYPHKTDEVKEKDSEQYFPGVNPEAKALTQALAAFTDTSDTHPPLIDVSPESIQHLWNAYAGSAGNFWGNQVLGNVTKLMTGEQIEERQIPFVRTFYGNVNRFVNQNIYYTLRDQELYMIGQMQAAGKGGNDDEIAAILARNPIEAAALPAFMAAEKLLPDIRAQRRGIQANKSLDASDRAVQLDANEKIMDEVMATARKAWEDARRAQGGEAVPPDAQQQ